MKRTLLRKYGLIFLVGAISTLCVCILVETFRVSSYFTNTHFKSFADLVFNFVSGWAAVISAATAFLLIITAFIAIWENRRARALDTVRNWAGDAIMLLYLPSREEMPLLQWSELEVKLKAICAKGVSALVVADSSGGDLEKNIKKAYAKVLNLIETVENADRFNDAIPSTEAVLKDLTKVIDSASD